MIEIQVPADPVPLSRPRFGAGRCYFPRRDTEYRRQVQWAARAQMKGAEPLTGAVTIEIRLFRRFAPTSRRFGDVDNHTKSILDALNSICYSDDSQVVRCTVEKFRDKSQPRAEIRVSEVES